MSDEIPRPTSNEDREGWELYWTAQGMPWRTEPEIDEERQRFLVVRREVKPVIERGVYPFRDEGGAIMLTRADVEWLLATHESGGMQGPVDWSDVTQREREGLDLRGADLSRSNLHGLPLAKMKAGTSRREIMSTHAQQYSSFEDYFVAHRRSLAKAQRQRIVTFEHANLVEADLRGATLNYANLQHAALYGARLECSDMSLASMEHANLVEAHLAGAIMQFTNLSGADLVRAELVLGITKSSQIESRKVAR